VERVLSGKGVTVEPLERVVVPKEVAEWKATAELRGRAEAVQTANREALQGWFAKGLAVIGYERDGQGNGVFLLGKLEKSTALSSDVR